MDEIPNVMIIILYQIKIIMLLWFKRIIRKILYLLV